MDSNGFGRFGTLLLLKRLQPDHIVTTYPIDDEEVTFGRDPKCSIRLYYDSVSALHCKLIFQDRKAFVEVFGTHGVVIDGCPVFPSSSASPTTVPLPNNSTLEIHHKRFQFSYPPKELRAALISTPQKEPGKPHTRRLRLSMIQSAQVFSPRPSTDPRENLRILQTPIKTPFKSHVREPSPLKRGTVIDYDEEEEEDIVLVESNHPRVVEEDRDLVILEHVEVKEEDTAPATPLGQPPRMVQYPLAAPQLPQVQQTPRRRTGPRPSLHRAVLIRSAQRAAIRREIDREEEEQDVEEVEDFIQSDVGDDIPDSIEEIIEEVKEEEQDESNTPVAPVSGWRKSLGALKGGLVWPFRASSVPNDVDEEEDEQDITEAHVEGAEEHERQEGDCDEFVEDDEENPFEIEDAEEEEDLHTTPVAPRAPILGNFMTPQVSRVDNTRHARYSIGGFTPSGARGLNSSTGGGGDGPQRVRVVEPWKVEDLVVPEVATAKEETSASVFESPTRKREKLSKEERQAILERRRSALSTPDAFSGGYVPGSRRTSLFPMPVSPSKAQAPLPALDITQGEVGLSSVKEDEDENTQVLLARMKQMVEGVKNRQSIGIAPRPSTGKPSLSPKKPIRGFSLFAPEDTQHVSKLILEETEEEGEGERLVEHEEEVDNRNGLESDTDGHSNEGHETSTTLGKRQRSPIQQRGSKTPRMGGLRRVFVAPREAPTPSFKGMREMFAAPTNIPSTPKFKGMREMFSELRDGPATPRMEGMSELFAQEQEQEGTILGSNAPPQDHGVPSVGENVEEVDAEIEEEEGPESEQVIEPVAPVPSRVSRAKKAPSRIPAARRAAPRSAPAKVSMASKLPVVVENEAVTVDSAVTTKSTAARVVRRTKTRTVDNDQGTTGAPRSSRTRKVKTEEPEDITDIVTEFAKPRASGRKKTPMENIEDEVAPSTKARRGRKATVSPSPNEDAGAGTTRSLRTRSITPQVVRASGSKPRGGGNTTRPIEAALDDDPLDSVDHEDGPEPAPLPSTAVKVRRATRGKAAVKDEDTEESPALTQILEDVEVVAPRGGRGRKTPAKSTTAMRSGASSIPRTRAGSATLASKSLADTAGRKAPAGDKENTPDPEDDAGPASADTAKTKVTRSSARTRSVTAEPEEGVTEPTKTRVSRAKARK